MTAPGPDAAPARRRIPTPGCGRPGSATGRCGSCRPASCCPTASPPTCASWIYVFGVAALAALAVVIVTGLALALGGPAWWHTYPRRALRQQPAPVERRAVLRLHGHPPVGQVLDGGLARQPGDDLDHRRRSRSSPRSWTAFTGYLSQPNFDSQWIATKAKDASQRGRDRRVLQRDELRPDADVAHRPPPHRRWSPSWARTSCWSGCTASATRCPSAAPAAWPRGARRGPPTGPRGAGPPGATTF